MGWAYPITILEHDGRSRQVLIPWLPSGHGRRIWRSMKVALSQIAEPMDDRTRETVRRIDELITREAVSRPNSKDEEVLGRLAARIEDWLGIESVLEFAWKPLNEANSGMSSGGDGYG